MRGHNTTYIALGLLVFLSDLSREPLEVRKYSLNVGYINQSLEVLEAIEECSVAQKISHFVAEFSASLLGDSTTEMQPQTERSLLAVPGLPVPDFVAFFSANPGEYQIDSDTFNFFEQGLQDFVTQ